MRFQVGSWGGADRFFSKVPNHMAEIDINWVLVCFLQKWAALGWGRPFPFIPHYRYDGHPLK